MVNKSGNLIDNGHEKRVWEFLNRPRILPQSPPIFATADYCILTFFPEVRGFASPRAAFFLGGGEGVGGGWEVGMRGQEGCVI